SKPKDLKKIRQRVGMVFQFPEGQLFEETVLKDVMFGPMNFGDDEATAREKAEAALAAVGIASTLFERSPFELSGGQMRRVAIAGVIAMNPEVLVLDEPTAGLDPKGRIAMMNMFDRLYHDQGLTIVLVTHQMEDVAAYANHVIVMDAGTCVKEGAPAEVFADPDWLASHQLALPDAADFAFNLQGKLDRQLWDTATDVPGTVDALADLIGDKLALATGQNDDDQLSGFNTVEGCQLEMKDKLIIGWYIRGMSLMHRLEPRVKLVGLIVMMLLVFAATDVTPNIVMIAVVTSFVFFAGISLGIFLRGLKPMIVIIIFTVALQIL